MMPEGRAIRSMFAQIARKYDRANHLLTGGIDYYWHRCLVNEVKRQQPQRVLDLATGSGRVAFTLQRRLKGKVSITGVDFCEAMLEEARRKQFHKKAQQPITFICADCLQLPFVDDSFDAITIAFGLRNLEDRSQGLREMYRVLKKPHGMLYILEMTQPSWWVRPLYACYLRTVLPALAHCATDNPAAYQYLVDSIRAFPNKNELAKEIEHAAPFEVSAVGMTASIVAIHNCRIKRTKIE